MKIKNSDMDDNLKEKFENIFDKNARDLMKQWDIENFKKSHPRLYDVFLKSMEEVSGEKEV